MNHNPSLWGMSVDAAFTKAVATIKLLTNGPSALGAPPPDRRYHLYGLFKQAMEGDVEGIMARPKSDSASKGSQAKWDAWKSQEGLGKQEAKLEYVRCLLETMEQLWLPQYGEQMPTEWIELDKVYKNAKEKLDEPNEPRTGPRFQHTRRLSAASTTSTYSHFLRRNREFEQERSEIQADQLVDRMQSAYPPILPGAVGPQHLRHPSIPQSGPQLNYLASPVRVSTDTMPVSMPIPVPGSVPGSVPTSNSLAERVVELIVTSVNCVKHNISSGLNRVLYSITVDAIKLLAVISVIRLIASKPDILKRLPVSKRALATLGRLATVLLDDIGVEIRLKHRK